MALLLEGVLFLLFIGLLFIIRLYIVIKTGPKRQPGTRDPVAVLVVAGSGNVNNLDSLVFRYVWFWGSLRRSNYFMFSNILWLKSPVALSDMLVVFCRIRDDNQNGSFLPLSDFLSFHANNASLSVLDCQWTTRVDSNSDRLRLTFTFIRVLVFINKGVAHLIWLNLIE